MLTDEVDGFQEVLNGDHLDFPGALLIADDFAKCRGGGAVSAAGIDIDESDFSIHMDPIELEGTAGRASISLSAGDCSARLKPSAQKMSKSRIHRQLRRRTISVG
jgi:hypothetical protein